MVQRAVGESLRLLGKIASSETLERWGLTRSLEKLLYRGSKLCVSARPKRSSARARGEAARAHAHEASRSPAAGGMFDLTLTESQELVRDTMVRFAKERCDRTPCTPTSSRRPPGLLQEAHELGLTQLAVPEALGGAGESAPSRPTCWCAKTSRAATWASRLRPWRRSAWSMRWSTSARPSSRATYLPAFIGEQVLSRPPWPCSRRVRCSIRSASARAPRSPAASS